MLRENDDYLKMFLLTSLTSNNNYSYVTLIIVSITYIYNMFINTMPKEYFDIKLIYLRLTTKNFFNKIFNIIFDHFDAYIKYLSQGFLFLMFLNILNFFDIRKSFTILCVLYSFPSKKS